MRCACTAISLPGEIRQRRKVEITEDDPEKQTIAAAAFGYFSRSAAARAAGGACCREPVDWQVRLRPLPWRPLLCFPARVSKTAATVFPASADNMLPARGTQVFDNPAVVIQLPDKAAAGPQMPPFVTGSSVKN